MNNELSILQQENVQTIVQAAPVAFEENQISRQRCLDAGNALLNAIKQQGMNAELDQKAAEYIIRARATVKKMNTKRAPVTKLFDEIRANYTAIENDVDPSKRDTIPYQLQQFRNEYAAEVRRQEEEKRRAFMAQQQRIQTLSKYRTDVEEDYRRAFNGILNGTLNDLMRLNGSVTLQNYDDVYSAISSTPDELNETSLSSSRSMVLLPPNIDTAELAGIRKEVLEKLLPTFRETYNSSVVDAKLSYVQLMPSKKAELEKAAAASKEEAERIRQQMAARDAAEAERKLQERKAQEEKEKQQAELTKQQQGMASLFDNAAANVEAYQPKTAVKKKLVVLNANGIMQVLNTWWVNEGCTLSVDELTKMFKKQIAACEKMANAKTDPVFIDSDNLLYEDVVKAK